MSTSLRERVTLTTADGVMIIGDYVEPTAPTGWAVLLHMMPADRHSYDRFSTALEARGVASLSIDLRGHGESTQTAEGRALDYRQFTDADHQGSREDVKAAFEFLRAKGAQLEHTIIVGASIGANLALDALVENPQIRGAVLLSPGLDYRGITTDTLVQKIPASSALYLAASHEDEYSFATIRELAKIFRAQFQKFDLTVKELIEAKHGTAMFEREPEFMAEIVQWVVEKSHGV